MQNAKLFLLSSQKSEGQIFLEKSFCGFRDIFHKSTSPAFAWLSIFLLRACKIFERSTKFLFYEKWKMTGNGKSIMIMKLELFLHIFPREFRLAKNRTFHSFRRFYYVWTWITFSVKCKDSRKWKIDLFNAIPSECARRRRSRVSFDQFRWGLWSSFIQFRMIQLQLQMSLLRLDDFSNRRMTKFVPKFYLLILSMSREAQKVN